MNKKTLIKNANKDNSKNLKSASKNTSLWIPISLMVPAIIFFALFTVVPLLKAFSDSLEQPSSNFITSYGQVWSDPDWWLSLKNSLLYAIITVPITLILSLLISFSLSNIVRKRLRGFWQSIFFIPYVTSAIAISLTFVHLFSTNFGIFNWILGKNFAWLETLATDGPLGLISISIYGIWHGLAFQILILTTAMLSIDKRLYDAAAIDGASSRKVFFSITLPSIERTVWYLFTIGLIGALKVYPLALFSNDIDNAMSYGPTLLIYIYSALANGTPDYGKAGAASISLIVIVVLFNWAVRKFVKTIQKISNKVKENKSYEIIEQSRIRELRSVDDSKYEQILFEKIKDLESDLMEGDIHE